MRPRNYLDPANVDVDGQNLRIKLPARSYEGGEIFTNLRAGRRPHTPTWTGSATPSNREALMKSVVLATREERHEEAGGKYF